MKLNKYLTMRHCFSNVLPFALVVCFIINTSGSLFSQCYLERHNTTWHDTWTSCDKKASPNAKRDSSHWILYELGYEYTLGTSHFWNHNTPTSLAYGAKKIAVDYSQDGKNWTTWGDFSLQKANGSKYYEGEKGPDFKKLKARYLLLTILENYGGTCASLAELKINVATSSNITTTAATFSTPSAADCLSALTYPNPFKNLIGLDITNSCLESYTYHVEDIMGKIIYPATKISQKGLFNTQFNGSHLGSGVYFLVVNGGNASVRKKIMKVE